MDVKWKFCSTSESKRIWVNRFKYRYLMLEYITLEYFEY